MTKVSKNIGFNFSLNNAPKVSIKVLSIYPLRVIHTYGTWDAVGKERGKETFFERCSASTA